MRPKTWATHHWKWINDVISTSGGLHYSLSKGHQNLWLGKGGARIIENPSRCHQGIFKEKREGGTIAVHAPEKPRQHAHTRVHVHVHRSMVSHAQSFKPSRNKSNCSAQQLVGLSWPHNGVWLKQDHYATKICAEHLIVITNGMSRIEFPASLILFFLWSSSHTQMHWKVWLFLWVHFAVFLSVVVLLYNTVPFHINDCPACS